MGCVPAAAHEDFMPQLTKQMADVVNLDSADDLFGERGTPGSAPLYFPMYVKTETEYAASATY